MAKLSHSDSRRMYSWWWDSHISPKNSKWLQDNLTDMDSKVKTMIKLIEEDADSFARRAEMYYKKRPELMKMVEEFYRAYRALAERYDHATGVIRHAHKTMSEAFPNQVPQIFADDSPANSVSKTVPRTPNISTPAQALCEEGILQFDSLNSSNSHAIKQNGEFTDDSDSVTRRIVEVRKGLNFDEVEEREQSMQDSENHSVKEETQSRSEKVSESEGILTLKEALAKLEAEKEAGLAQYQQSLDKISILESDIAHAREVSRELSDRASKAENEAVSLKEELSKSESEKEANLQKYHQCLDKLSNLEKNLSSAKEDLEELNERASRAETEAHSLKDELTVVAVEKDTALNNYMRSLEMISNLENNLEITEEDARRLKERAEKAESEVEILKQTVSKLTEEKEAAALQYQQCLETISCLEKKLTNAQEEAQRLNSEIDYGVSKLKGAEEQCLLLERSNQSLHSELESLMLKMGSQTQELTEKDSELGRLWACIQEERLRFVEAETAFQTLQHLHAQTQEELRSLASELQRRAELLKTVESHNQSLQDEVLQVKEENKNLNEINESSALSIKDMENGITGLKGRNRKLEEEVELRLDERNALQQEIYCLKEELNDLNKNHISVLEQVHAVGINPRSLGSSVKELQDENLNLKKTCSREQNEKVNLLKKLEILEQLLEKNSILETSLSYLNAELELVRGQMEALDQSCRSLSEEKSSLLDEKDTLMTRLQVTSENLEKLLEKNSFLDNSLSDAHDELQALRAESTSLENLYQLIEKEKAVLISERGDLTSQLETTRTKLEDMFKTYGDLKEKYKALEKEKESTLGKLGGLQMSLDVERQKHANFVQMNDQRFTDIQAEMELLQEESQQRKRELEEVLDNALNYDIETFVLRITVQDLEENSCSLLIKHQKLLEESSSSEKLISNLERDNVEQKVQIKSLFNQATSLRERTYEVMKALHIVQDCPCDDQNGQDHIYLNQLLNKVHDMKKSLHQAEIENLQQTVELSVLVILIGHLRLEVQNLELEKNTVEHEFKIKTEQFLMLQSKVFELNETNKELLSKLREGDSKEEVLMAQIEDLHRKLTNMQDACRVLHGENLDLHKEKRSLTDAILLLKQNKHILQEENWILYGEMLTLDNLSFIFGNCIDEKCVLLRQLGSDLNKLHDVNGALMGNLSFAEGRLEKMQMENAHVKEGLQKTDEELRIFSIIKDNLTKQIENGENVLNEKELKLQEAEQKVNLLETKNFELNKLVEGLSMESNELKMIREGQENQILKLSADNGALMGNLSLAEGRLEKMQMENDHVKEGLLKAEEELRIFSIVVKDNLTKQIENGENMLNGKELELQEAEQKVNLLENKNFELTKLVEGLSMESNELKMIREGQENQILKLSAGNGALMGNLSLAEGRLEKMQLENDHVKEGLLKAEEELRIFSIVVKDNLTKQIENGENMLNGKELELQEAEQKVNLLENKNFELTKLVEGLSMESKELKMIREGQENQILKLSAGNGALTGNLSLAEGRLEKMQMENDHVEEGLLKAEEELRIFSIVVKDNLTKQIENGENVLNGKELELQEAEQKVNLLENKNFELTKLVEGLSMESNELKMIREGRENQILKLSADNDHLSIENNRLSEASHVLELNLHNLRGEHKKRKTQEENLHSELHKKINEIEMWEIEAASLFNQLQMSIVSQLLYEQKFHELCKTFVDSINENEGLRTQLAAYGPTVISLEECISSLEKNISLPVKRQDSDDEKMEGSQDRNRLIGNHQNENENEKEKRAAPDTFSGLQNLQVRIQAIEQAAVEIYQLRVQETVDLHLKLEAATRQVEELLKLESSQYRRNMKSSTEISEADDILLTKDIMLDQISESSSRNHDFHRVKSAGKQKGEQLVSDGLIEEELSVNKLEISKRFTDPLQEGNKGKVLERLNSDIQKLANLQITVQDLKRKLEVTEKGRMGKALTECETLKGQLEEADISIMKLNDLNGKLIKSIENNSVPDVKSSFDSEDDGNVKRRRILEQARTISEKIGRLQLEVQKLQFVLLKLDEKDNKEKLQTAGTNRKTVLRDYLYGATTNGRKKSRFWSCVKPSTTGD